MSVKAVLKIDPKSFYKCKVFDLPDDFRQAAVDHMREQSNVEWVCGKDFGVFEKFKAWGIDLPFIKGEKYRGMPYSDSRASVYEFIRNFENNEYTCASNTWSDVCGAHCMSSIMNSIQQFTNIGGTSNIVFPGYSTCRFKICGEYEIFPEVSDGTEVVTTLQIINLNGREKIAKEYCKLQKGDMIMTKNDIQSTSHIRMLVKPPVIVYDDNGEIDPEKSHVQTIEQTNKFDETRTDGVKTTWYVDHIYTFKDMLDNSYIPMTIDAYTAEEAEIPYIALDKEIKISELENRLISGCVKSNFPLRYVYLELYSSDGKLVRRSIVNKMLHTHCIDLGTCNESLFRGKLEAGEYTFVLTAGISKGEYEFERKNFTIK